MTNSDYSRRDFLRVVGAGAAAAFSGRLFGVGKKPRKPNIIFIMADDLGYGDLGCYGQKLIKTPSVDRLAVEGTLFTQCYAGATVCAPSRSVLMTGQHTGHTRIRDNSPKVGGTVEAFGEGDRRLSLEAEDVTVAEVLKEAGYVTGITGKWGLGEPGTDGIPNKQGFDEWYGYLNQNHAPYYYTDYLWRNEKKEFIEENKGRKRGKYSHDLLSEFALDFIRRHKDDTFFLYIPYCIPHRKFEVPSKEPYKNESWPEQAKIYAAMITRMDSDVGRIMDLLKELDIDDETIVFFTSDNGAEGGKKGWLDLFNSCPGMRGYKSSLYEGGIRVPMVVRWPGKVPAGKVSDSVWYFADVLPTFAELAGAKAPKNIDGISVVPSLLGKKQQNLNGRFLYWEEPDAPSQAVRWGKYKAIRRGLDGQMVLYDLDKDLAESNDIASQNPEVVSKIEEYLKTARTESPHWPSKTASSR
ncbi:MAG: arylsulfatase [Planctomycetota bacterium]